MSLICFESYFMEKNFKGFLLKVLRACLNLEVFKHTLIFWKEPNYRQQQDA